MLSHNILYQYVIVTIGFLLIKSGCVFNFHSLHSHMKLELTLDFVVLSLLIISHVSSISTE